jgi:Reverse transcriptase (RNA-dependent DNA polymerase)
MCPAGATGLDRLAGALFACHRAAPGHASLGSDLSGRRRLQRAAGTAFLTLAEQPRPAMLPLPGTPRPAALPPLVTPTELATWLGIDLDRLQAWTRTFRADPEPRSSRLLHYHRRWIARRIAPPRLIEAPKPSLKQIQQRLLHDLLDHVPAHPAAHGFVRGRGITSFTAPHRNTACVLRLDLRDFFASITRRRVRAVFSALGYPVEVAQQLAALTTTAVPVPLLRELVVSGAAGAALHERLRQPHLPQGAPSSPALANLVAFRLDARLDGLARRFGASYTRYADDLLFSGDSRFARGSVRCAAWVERILAQEGFALAPSKTRSMRPGTRQHAAGMVLNVHAAGRTRPARGAAAQLRTAWPEHAESRCGRRPAGPPARPHRSCAALPCRACHAPAGAVRSHRLVALRRPHPVTGLSSRSGGQLRPVRTQGLTGRPCYGQPTTPCMASDITAMNEFGALVSRTSAWL